jgi:(2R)-3-sulfolactate dehydrogenase (NADP+)
MTEMMTLTVREARKLISDALIGAGTAVHNARYFSEAILDTELAGLEGHGFFWLQFYCAHVKSGKVDGQARPKVTRASPVAFNVDARHGFAHPAIEAGFAKLIPAAKKYGIAALAVRNSYNAATLGFHTGYLARAGLIAFGFTNGPALIAPVGGRIPVLGTNPMSFAVPAPRGKIAFVIDQSSSAVAWTAVKRAAEQGREIPLGWAVDKEGQPTTNPERGLEGSMAPFGGYKGFGQGLIVEAMCAALAGANRSVDMGSFTENDGKRVGAGQFFIALNPKSFAGGLFHRQINELTKSIASQNGARLPNARREVSRERLAKEGLKLERSLYEALLDYASGRSRAP